MLIFNSLFMRTGDSFSSYKADKFTTIDNDNDYYEGEGGIQTVLCSSEAAGGTTVAMTVISMMLMESIRISA